MGKILILVFLFQQHFLSAQPVLHETTQSWFDAILKADVVTGASNPEVIFPNSTSFCFDKRLEIQVSDGTREGKFCMFIDTRKGIVGYFPTKTNVCELRPGDEKFMFTVISLKGNSYYYVTGKKNNQIQKKVMTVNSLQNRNNMNENWGNMVLQKTNETKLFYGGIEARAYINSGSAESRVKYFIYSKSYPAQIQLKRSKYLGNLMVGYQMATSGLCLIMEAGTLQSINTVNLIEDENTCFDPSSFNLMEEEYLSKMTDKIGVERFKQESKINKGFTGPCADIKYLIAEFTLQSLRRQEQKLSTYVLDNTLTSDPAARAMISALYNYEDQMMIMIYTQELKICETQDLLNKTTSAATQNTLNSKLSCLRLELGKMRINYEDMRDAAVRLAESPAELFLVQTRLLTRNIRPCN